MYARLAYGWGNSLLAMIATLLGLPAPFLFWKYGPWLRAKSQYAAGGEKEWRRSLCPQCRLSASGYVTRFGLVTHFGDLSVPLMRDHGMSIVIRVDTTKHKSVLRENSRLSRYQSSWRHRQAEQQRRLKWLRRPA